MATYRCVATQEALPNPKTYSKNFTIDYVLFFHSTYKIFYKPSGEKPWTADRFTYDIQHQSIL